MSVYYPLDSFNLVSGGFLVWISKLRVGTGEMVRQSKRLGAVAWDLSSVPSPYIWLLMTVQEF